MPKVSYAVEAPVDWAAYSVMPGVNDTLPFIYEFRIKGVGSYIGETGNPKRAKRHYRRKVRMLLNDKPVRHRRVHRALAEAHRRRLAHQGRNMAFIQPSRSPVSRM